jgi:hypothetical protein
MSDKENAGLTSSSKTPTGGEDERMDILGMIESGEIDVEEGLKRLKDENVDDSSGDPLSKLEAGEIDVSEAIRIIEREGVSGDESSPDPGPERETVGPSTEKWRSWWLLIPATGFVVTAFGGWLGTIGGWWWLCAAPSLLLGIFILLFGLVTQNAPWLHIRVDTGQKTWPRRIAISFPVPIRLASWGIRTWGHYAGSIDATAVDELLLSLEGNLSSDNPIHIQVDEDDETGEKIQVYLG